MARTKTTPANPENHTSPEASSQSPPPNTTNDQISDHSSLKENPVHTVLPDVIYPDFEEPKSSKPKTSKKPIIKPKPTRRSQRMRTGSSSKKPTVSHVDLVSDGEKEEKSIEEMEEGSEEKEEEVPSTKGKEAVEEEANSEETLSELAKAARLVYKRRKVATSSLSAKKPSSPSQ